MALWPRVNVSLQAVAQILLVIGLGVWLALRRGLDRKSLAAVSSVNWFALIPALMFSSIVGAVTPSGLLMLWPLLVLSLLHVVMGVVPALLLCYAARLPRDMSFFTVMASSLPNCGNLPWLFMPTLIRFFTPPDQVAAQIQYSTGLTSVYTIMVVVITLTVPFLFNKPPETLLLPRNSSSASLGTQEDEEQQQQQPEDHQHHQHHQHVAAAAADPHHWQLAAEHSSDKQHQSSDPTQPHSDHQQQQHSAAAAAAPPLGATATAWVVPASTATTKPDAAAAGAGGGGDTPLRLGDDDDSDTDSTRIAAAAAAHDRSRPRELLQLGPDSSRGGDQRHKQQQQHFPSGARQPSVGRLDSFTSPEHSGSSFLMTHSRQLFGSFSRSFSRGVNRGLRRSASFVQLVWSYPTGWQPQRRAAGSTAAAAAAAAARHQRSRAGSAAHPAWLQRLRSLWASFLAHPVVNLPLGATAAGLACAAVGPVRGLLVNELAALHWLWLGLSWVGTAAAPLATMQIGAELVQTAPAGDSMHVSRRVQWTANAIAIVVKLVVVPLANVALLRLGGLASWVPATDGVYQLLMLVQAAVPAAVTLLVVCSRVYPDIRPLSSMLFWQYVASLFTLPAFLVWYLNMLQLG